MSNEIYRAEVKVNGEFYAMTSGTTPTEAVRNAIPYLVGYEADKIELSVRKQEIKL